MTEIQDGGSRWPPFRNNCAIITSCDVVTHDADVIGDIFRHAIYSPKSR